MALGDKDYPPLALFGEWKAWHSQQARSNKHNTWHSKIRVTAWALRVRWLKLNRWHSAWYSHRWKYKMTLALAPRTRSTAPELHREGKGCWKVSVVRKGCFFQFYFLGKR